MLFFFILITIICGIAHQYMFESDSFKNIHKFWRYTLAQSLLFIVAGLGFLAWKRRKIIWPKNIWIISYAAIIIIMLVTGLIDLFVAPLSNEIKDTIRTLRFFFASPVPFSILWLLTTLKKVA